MRGAYPKVSAVERAKNLGNLSELALYKLQAGSVFARVGQSNASQTDRTPAIHELPPQPSVRLVRPVETVDHVS